MNKVVNFLEKSIKFVDYFGHSKTDDLLYLIGMSLNADGNEAENPKIMEVHMKQRLSALYTSSLRNLKLREAKK